MSEGVRAGFPRFLFRFRNNVQDGCIAEVRIRLYQGLPRGSCLGGWIHVNADDAQIGFRRSQATSERNEGSGTVSAFWMFQVDLQREELLKEGSRVHIPSKVFQVLLAAPQLNLLESKKSSIAENQPQACDSDRVFV
jgi:hypothetical protein